jgi:hypothetical protein
MLLQDSKQYCASLAHKTDIPPGLLFEPLKLLTFDINADPDPQTLTLCYMVQDSKQYCASLAHKCNHSFLPNSEFVVFDHPKFGLIPCLLSIADIPKDQEVKYYAWKITCCKLL